MRISMLTFLLLLSPLASANPNGATGDVSKWKDEWTEHFTKCFEKEGQHLKEKNPTDSGKYCEAVSPTGQDASKFWLSIFIPLAEKESNFDPNAHGQNGGKVPIGLFQMDSQDMKSHKCEGADPANPQQSICCAIKIADDQAQKFNQISQEGAAGIMSSFWQPMKDGMGGDGKGNKAAVNNTKNHEYIKTASKELCTSNFAKLESKGSGSDYSSSADSWKWNSAEAAQ